MKSYKEIAEALKGKQHKIDKNKNGQIDAQDFKLLRKEEADQLEEGLDPSEVASNPKMYDATTVKKAYYHKSTSASDKEYLAKHLDRHHGNKEWRKPVKEEAEQILEYGDTAKGQKLLQKVNKRAVERLLSKKADKDPAYARKAMDTHLAADSRLKEDLTEATVKTQKYSWGTMKTVHHGSDFSIPLHPEHHQAISKLKDNQEHNFKDETGRHWTAKRMGDDVHFQGANNGGTTKVKHSDLKEEADQEERMSRSDYKVSPSGRKSHKEIVFKHGEEDKKASIQEVAPPGFEGTVKAMKKHKEIDNPYALAWYLKNKGAKSHKNADGTMKKEQAEVKYPNKEKSDDVPFDGPYKKTSGTVTDKSGAKHTPMSIAKHLAKRGMKKVTKEETENVEEGVTGAVAGGIMGGMAGGPLGAVAGAYLGHKLQQGANNAKKLVKQKENEKKLRREEVEELEERNKENATKRKMMDASRGARFKAQGNYVPDAEPQHKTAQAHNKAIGRAIRQMSNEEVEQITEGMKTTHEDPLVTVHDKYDGKWELHTHANLSTANHIFGTNVKHTDVHAGPVSAKNREGKDLKFAISQHHAQAVKDEEKFRKQFGEQAPVAPTLDRKYIKGTPEHKAYKATKKPINGHPTNVKEQTGVSYRDFMLMLEYESKDGVYKHKGTYGGSYVDPEGADDADDKKPKQPQNVKRGRGRPAGAKSGARKITGTSKLYK